MQHLQNNLKIAIVGLGLIGGSLYKALVAKNFKKLYACTQNQQTLKKISNEGYVASSELEVLKDCDVIFVCSPISQTVHMVENIHRINKSALYVDVASLKLDICEQIKKFDNIRFIGSHPMAGTENSGFDASFEELFLNAKWVLTPDENASLDDIELLKKLISILGALPVLMDAASHDKAVAMISHTPMLIAQALIEASQNNEQALKLASSGFRDTTRLAMSNKIMASDMLRFNKQNIKEALEHIVQCANNLLDDEFFAENIDEIIDLRRKMYDENGKNIY